MVSPVRLLVLGAMLGAALPAYAPRLRHDRGWVADEIARRTGKGPGRGSAETPEVPPGVALEVGLGEDDAVAVALWNNAASTRCSRTSASRRGTGSCSSATIVTS